MNFLLIALLFSPLCLAVDPYTLSEEEINPETEEILIKKPEKYLRHDSMIYDLNPDLGIKDQRQYTGADKNKMAVAGHISGDYEHFNDIVGLELNYMHRSDRYDRLWYGVQLFQLKTYFDSITQNHDEATSDDPNSEAQTQRPNNVKNNVLAFGAGVGYRFKLLMDFYPTEDVFESVDVFANYVTMDETYIKRKYQGYGLTTSYSITKRTSTKYFWGGKFAYNIASVTREAIGTESKSDRSFALGWLSIGLELGFFF